MSHLCCLPKIKKYNRMENNIGDTAMIEMKDIEIIKTDTKMIDSDLIIESLFSDQTIELTENYPEVIVFILECAFCQKIYSIRGMHRPTVLNCGECGHKNKHVTEKTIFRLPLINIFTSTCSICLREYTMTACRPPTNPLCWKCGDLRETFNKKEEIKKETIVEFNSDRLKKDNTCVVCLDRDITMVITTCGHLCCCKDCGMDLKNCPVCRKSYNPRKELVRVYHVK